MKKLLAVLSLLLIVKLSTAQPGKGTMAPEISLPNAKDSIVRLSSFKGKVVLIDFWASWCGPCRNANPQLVKLFDKYRSRGFEVIGISLDDNKKDWLRAVRQDNLRYTQVIDLAKQPGAVAGQYGIRVIPTTFLIDKTGKITGVDLEKEQLEQVIEKLL